MASKNYHYKEWFTEEHKKFPYTNHTYLYMRTDEYEVLIHCWGGCLRSSRIRLISRISGASLEVVGSSGNLAYDYIKNLLKTKNRNREIWNLETELENNFCSYYDASFPTLHESKCHIFNRR
ncbi:MAG: hypothetical protein AABX77_00535 [Nanoarchaeota archaeon]